jgi:signal transduction histidine kinase
MAVLGEKPMAIDTLGGQFSLESPVGSGTTVSVNLPAAVIPPSGWT